MSAKGLIRLEHYDSPAVLKVGSGEQWATLRAVRFHGRPAHADQLHVDLWWCGVNIARDAGTYLYNGTEPWTNSLDRTSVHNTVLVDQMDQMERISRFLWLDQAQATVIQKTSTECAASHDGYKKRGVIHRRTLNAVEGQGFLVQELLEVLPGKSRTHKFCIHWLLPDWYYQIDGTALTLTHFQNKVRVTIYARKLDGHEQLKPMTLSLIRGGETLHGIFNSPIHGWESKTYAHKIPTLSYLVEYESSQSIEITTKWEFPHD